MTSKSLSEKPIGVVGAGNFGTVIANNAGPKPAGVVVCPRHKGLQAHPE